MSKHLAGGLVLGTVLATALSLWAQPNASQSYPAYVATNINSNATTTPLSGAGVLHTVCINNAGAASNTATIYDNTAGSGTVIALIDTVELNGRCFIYDAAVGTGITVVTATGTAADMTVTHRALR